MKSRRFTNEYARFPSCPTRSGDTNLAALVRHRMARVLFHVYAMNVLIGCEESGTIRDEFTRAGFFAMSCDFQPSRTPGPHYQGDIFDVLYAGWDLLIVHPPCTYLSSSGLHWNKNPKSPRYGGRQTIEALEFVRRVWAAPIKSKVMENPIGCISTRLNMPATQIIQPYEFGDDASKATCLWIEGFPALVKDPKKRFPGRLVQYNGKTVERWSNQTDSGQNRLGPSEDRAKIRSVTYPGIARAMVEQWAPILRGGAAPCKACGYVFDVDALGKYGCPNCCE